MERSIILTLITLLILGFLAVKRDTIISLASVLTPTPALSPAVTLDSSWYLVFNDEFEGTALDIDKWLTMFPWGRNGANSSELQYYAEDAFELINGIHRIRAEKRSMSRT